MDYFLAQMRERVKADHASRENKSPYQQKFEQKPLQPVAEKKTVKPAEVPKQTEAVKPVEAFKPQVIKEDRPSYGTKPAAEPKTEKKPAEVTEPQQMELFDKKLLAEESIKEHKIIGQLFDTYWLVEFDEKLFIIDQHAAHEKVLYERTLKGLKNKEHTSQLLSPPMVLSLSMQEEALLKKYM